MSLPNTSYAAWVSDPEHQVAFGLYPYPETEAALTLTLEQLAAMPHAPEEANEIRARLLSADCLSAEQVSALEATFGVEALADHEPVKIQLDQSSYALVYAGLQCAQEQLGPLVSPTEPEDARQERHVSRVREVVEAAVCERYQEGAAALARIESTLETVQATLVGLQVLEAVEGLSAAVAPEALTAAQAEASRYLAETVALYEQMLRKPRARGKSVDALATELAARGLDTLRFMLEDLRLEYTTSQGATLAAVPKIPDPTGDTAAAQETAPASPDEESTSEDGPPAFLTNPEEWPSEGEDKNNVWNLWYGMPAEQKVEAWQTQGLIATP